MNPLEDEDIAIIVSTSLKGMGETRMDFQMKPSASASALVHILFDQGCINRENEDSIQIRVHNALFFPSETQRISDFAVKNEIYVKIISRGEKDPDKKDIDVYKQILTSGAMFKKFVNRISTSRFVCCSVDLEKVIWSVSQVSYYKGDYKGEMKVNDIIQVRSGKSNGSYFTSQFGGHLSNILGHKSIEINCFSLIGKGKKSLHLEACNFITMKIFCEAFSWLIKSKSHNSSGGRSPGAGFDSKATPSTTTSYSTFSTFSIFNKTDTTERRSEDYEIPESGPRRSLDGDIITSNNILLENKSREHSATLPAPLPFTTTFSNNIPDTTFHKSSSKTSISKSPRTSTRKNMSSEEPPPVPFNLANGRNPLSRMNSSNSKSSLGSKRSTVKRKMSSTKLSGNSEQINNAIFRLADQLVAALAIIDPKNEFEYNLDRSKDSLEVSVAKLTVCADKLLSATSQQAFELALHTSKDPNKKRESILSGDEVKEQEFLEYLVNDLTQRRMGDMRQLELQQEINAKELEISKLNHFIATGLGGVCAECSNSLSSNSVETSISINNSVPSDDYYDKPPSTGTKQQSSLSIISELDSDTLRATTSSIDIDSLQEVLDKIASSKDNVGNISNRKMNKELNKSRENSFKGKLSSPSSLKDIDITIESQGEASDSISSDHILTSPSLLIPGHRKRLSFSDLDKTYTQVLSNQLQSMFILGNISWSVLSYIEDSKHRITLTVIGSGSERGTIAGKYFTKENTAFGILRAITDGHPAVLLITWIGENIDGLTRAKMSVHESKIIEIIRNFAPVAAILRPQHLEECTEDFLFKNATFLCQNTGISSLFLEGDPVAA